jgi:glycosyltransferase involved in cell wall biosynthesis
MVEHEVTGLLTPVGDIKKLCDNINLLLKNEKYRNTLAFNAQKFAKAHWSLETMTERLMVVYEEAIAMRGESEENEAISEST